MKFYSDLTKKIYDTAEELEAAEAELKKAEEEKANKTAVRKKDASKVEDAFKLRNQARRNYNKQIVKLRKEYGEALAKIKEEFNKGVDEANKIKNEAEEAYDAAFKEFTGKYKDYHLTLRDGDNVVTISSEKNTLPEIFGLKEIDFTKEFNTIFDNLLNLWKF